MSAFGIATTSALMVRVHCCTGAGAAGAAAGAGAVGGVSGFTSPVSALGVSVAGFTVSSFAGAATGAGAMAGAAAIAAGFETEGLNSATGLFTAATGVCAPAIAALNKQKVITVNEETTGVDLAPRMFTSPLRLLNGDIERLRINLNSDSPREGSFQFKAGIF